MDEEVTKIMNIYTADIKKERSFEDHSNAPLIFVLVQMLTMLSHF